LRLMLYLITGNDVDGGRGVRDGSCGDRLEPLWMFGHTGDRKTVGPLED
jgi:hypothetical protein